MGSQSSGKKRQRTPAKAARSAHGQRVQDAPRPSPIPASRPPPPTPASRASSKPAPRRSSSLAFAIGVRTRADARVEAAAIEAAVAESAAVKSTAVETPAVGSAVVESTTVESTVESATAATPADTPTATTPAPSVSASSQQNNGPRTRARAAAAKRDDDINTANVANEPTTNPTTSAAPAPAPAARPQKPLSVRKILAHLFPRLLARFASILARLLNRPSYPSSAANTASSVRPLFADIRSGEFGDLGGLDAPPLPLQSQPQDQGQTQDQVQDQDQNQDRDQHQAKKRKKNKKETKKQQRDNRKKREEEKKKEEEEQEQRKKQQQQRQRQQKKEQKKRRDDALRQIIARVVHDTRDGSDAFANGVYFLQVLEEVQRVRKAAASGDNGADGGSEDVGDVRDGGGDEWMDGLSWYVDEVFKMVVILVSWQRPLAPMEGDGEDEDEGCVLSMGQVVALVEGEIEQAIRVAEGSAD